MFTALILLASSQSVMFTSTSNMFTAEHVQSINSIKVSKCVESINEPVIGGITLKGKRVCP